MNCQVYSSYATMPHLVGSLAMVFTLTTQVGAGDLQLGSGCQDSWVARLRLVIVSPPVKKGMEKVVND